MTVRFVETFRRMIAWTVRVLVVLVMHMHVLMFQCLVHVLMLVPLRDVEPHSKPH